MDKTMVSALEAVCRIASGSSIAVGGFGAAGVPDALVNALLDSGATHLKIISNNCGLDGWGLGKLLEAGRVDKVIASFIGNNKEFERQYLAGQLELELTPQGTLAERMRAGGVGIPGFYTAAGVGTLVAEGGLPMRYAADGTVQTYSLPKETRILHSLGQPREYVFEAAIRSDYSFVRATRGDRHGNLIFDKSARNFNPLVAMCGDTTFAEVESIVDAGELDADHIHLPGIFVDGVVLLQDEQVRTPIEKRVTRQRILAEAH
ncbi:CoA transferase subunit A [Subtercola endophyticus]|uniref:CoA transferase subunit A n=1 Tax=Subtercola endophyticus TaxID=2895559 RepID=UPI001E3EC3B9|nr:CoA transferase subunit A [Subtercola endophyticus]UFS57849.1 CoA transferase subunit A [Subtercola endophyticus]